MAVIICLAIRIAQPTHSVIIRNILGLVFHEIFDGIPQVWNGRAELQQGDCPAVRFVVLLHELEGVLHDITVEVNIRFDTPIPTVFLEKLVLEEELDSSR